MSLPGVPQTVIDDDRLRTVIELGLVEHPDRDRVARFLRAGAGFVMRADEDDVHVIVALRFDETAPLLAAHRAEVWAGEPLEVRDEDRDELLEVVRVPLSVLGQPPQG